MKLDSPINIDYVRSDFPILKRKINGNPLVFFDSGASAQTPQVVIDAVSTFYSNYYSNVHRGIHELSQEATNRFEAVRGKVQQFIKAQHEHEIIFTSGTTDAINLVAKSYGRAFINPGDVVLISEMEHHANIVSWQIMLEDRGAELQVFPITDAGEIDFEAYKLLLNDNVKLVALSHISNVLGTINPVKKIISEAHAHNIPVLLDGAQAVPHMKVDVQDLDVDFYTFSGHKLFATTGTGVLYGKEEYLNKMPPIMGGGDMIDKVSFEETTFNDLPHKFEAGTPNIAGFIGLGAAIDYVNNIGIENIERYEEELIDYMLEKLNTVNGLRLIGTAEHRASVFSFVIEGLHALDIGTLLNEYGIAVRTGHHCAQPLLARFDVTSTARASLAFYNTKEEIDVFIEKLNQVKEILC